MPLLAKDIEKSFGSPPTHVLKGISFQIEDGEFVSITGKSGSGKSTLLYVISSLDFPTQGDVNIDGQTLSKLNDKEIHHFRNINMGFVFQFHYLLPELTALENILMPAFKTKSGEQRKPYALELLDRFGIADKRNRRPSQLSGGEQQRVAIARSLVMKPRYIFADEPTGNLDSFNSDIVFQIFQEVNKADRTTILYVTHDPDYAALAGREIHLVDGQLSN